MVYRVEIIEVKITVRKTRSVKTVDEIVVSREGDRTYSACLELDAQTFAEGRLAAAARTCDESPEFGIAVAK